MAKLIGTVIAIAALLAAAGFIVRALLAAASDHESRAHLVSIGLAIRNYEQMHRRFPSPNADGHSWRIRILPFLFASPMYQEYHFDEPWNGENNRMLDLRALPRKDGSPRPYGMPYPYTDSSDRTSQHATRFLMFVGEHAFGLPDGYRRAADIKDDPHTVLVAAETHLADVHWLRPFDFDADDMLALRSLLGDRHSQAPAVLFADGSVYRMSLNVPEHLLAAMITIDGSEAIDPEELIRTGYLH